MNNKTRPYDLIAKYYDLRPRGSQKEINFYINEARRSRGPVLELGCGTGRITTPIAHAGINILGVDESAKMLKIAKSKTELLGRHKKCIAFSKQNMEDFKSHKLFSLIIIPYKTFLYLTKPEDQVACLGNCFRHLKRNGKLIIDIYSPRLDVINHCLTQKSKWEYVETLIDKKNKLTIKRYDKRVYRPEIQVLEQTSKYIEYNQNHKEMRQIKMRTTSRYIFRYEMEFLLKLAGFEKIFLYGSFNKEKYTNRSKTMLWIAQG